MNKKLKLLAAISMMSLCSLSLVLAADEQTSGVPAAEHSMAQELMVKTPATSTAGTAANTAVLAGQSSAVTTASQAAPASPNNTAPTAQTASVRNSNLDAYYITKGDTFDKVTALLESLPTALTSLSHQQGDYYWRMDKELTSDYFYHIRALSNVNDAVLGDFLVAKDDSCAWRLDTGKDAAMIYGSANKMMKKVEVYIYPEKIIMGGHGRLRLHIPGKLPYDIKLTSLNESVAKITEHNMIEPISYGKVDILVDLKIGDVVQSYKLRAKIVDRSYYEGRSSSRPNIGVGIGIGWGGGGWHHHHGGGVGIGIGIDDIYLYD